MTGILSVICIWAGLLIWAIPDLKMRGILRFECAHEYVLRNPRKRFVGGLYIIWGAMSLAAEFNLLVVLIPALGLLVGAFMLAD